jgi:DNA-binding NarL/FixJ family response regulator
MLIRVVTDSLESILAPLLADTGAESASIVRFDRENRACEVRATAGGTILGLGSTFPLGESTNMVAAASGATFFSDDYSEAPEFDRVVDRLSLASGLRAGCTVPLLLGSQPVGALTVNSRSAGWDCESAIERIKEVSATVVLAMCSQAGATPEHRVLVCHDDQLVAEGIARLAEAAVGARVEACGGAAATIARQLRSADDLVVTDCYVQGERLDEQLRTLRASGIAPQVLVVATHDTPQHRRMALEHGVRGYCARDAGSAALRDALRSVADGHSTIAVPAAVAQEDPPPLTTREREVLLLLNRGLQVKEIAGELAIAATTVKGYVRSILGKLDAHTTRGALHAARSTGLLQSIQARADDSTAVAAAPSRLRQRRAVRL